MKQRQTAPMEAFAVTQAQRNTIAPRLPPAVTIVMRPPGSDAARNDASASGLAAPSRLCSG